MRKLDLLAALSFAVSAVSFGVVAAQTASALMSFAAVMLAGAAMFTALPRRPGRPSPDA